MTEYDNAFPPSVNDEEKSALLWKIEQDYQQSQMAAIDFKNEYITFAINFYTRNIYSLEDVLVQYRAHKTAEQRQRLAQVFMTDMKSRLRAYELAHN